MALMCEIFDKKLSQQALELYWQTLSGYSDEQCRTAFDHILKYSKYFPKPADIIEAIEQTSSPGSISPSEARIQIENWLYNGGPEPQHPIIQAVIKSYGGWERLGMTNYQDLKYLLRDIEARFEALSARPADTFQLESPTEPELFHSIPSQGTLSSLDSGLKDALDHLAGHQSEPIRKRRLLS